MSRRLLNQRALRSKRVLVLYTSGADSDGLPEMVRQAEDLSGNAKRVAAALCRFGHTVKCADFGMEATAFIKRLRTFAPDVVFNLAEAPLRCYEKEPHAVALLELLRVPYTGSGPLPLSVCKDKGLTKQILQAHGIPTPACEVYETAAPKRRSGLTFPLVVKPLREDGSMGITDQSVVETDAELRRAVAYLREEHGQDALAEEFLCGREFNVSLIGNGTSGSPYRVLPPGELVYHSPRWRVCTFDAKWDEAHPSYAAVEAICPTRIRAHLERQLVKLTEQCARVFGICGYARLDFRLDQKGRPQLFDVNPNPDLAPRMGVARAAEAAGISYAELVHEILRLGMEKGAR